MRDLHATCYSCVGPPGYAVRQSLLRLHRPSPRLNGSRDALSPVLPLQRLSSSAVIQMCIYMRGAYIFVFTAYVQNANTRQYLQVVSSLHSFLVVCSQTLSGLNKQQQDLHGSTWQLRCSNSISTIPHRCLSSCPCASLTVSCSAFPLFYCSSPCMLLSIFLRSPCPYSSLDVPLQ